MDEKGKGKLYTTLVTETNTAGDSESCETRKVTIKIVMIKNDQPRWRSRKNCQTKISQTRGRTMSKTT